MNSPPPRRVDTAAILRILRAEVANDLQHREIGTLGWRQALFSNAEAQFQRGVRHSAEHHLLQRRVRPAASGTRG
jgi:hypothetical protein